MTTTEARTIAAEAARAYREAFGDRLIGAYLLGSLSYGGYSPAVSDIDLAIVLTDVRDGDPSLVSATTEALQGQSPLHRKLSVFWASLPALREGRDDGRFPAQDRLQLADHGRVLLGADVTREVARPPAADLLRESAKFAIAVLATDEVTAEFRTPRRLLADKVWFTKAVFFPVRFRYSATTESGRAATNDESLEWYLAQPEAPSKSLVRLGARVREGHPLDAAEVEPELAAGLVPLYRHYIEAELRRLREAGEPEDLVDAFEDWLKRLG
ncbi:DNA polymerase [Amycolatopsis vancoresmycina]|uniref:DNA polymerase n=1 Tax=Amycolatopsis vancoresmycina TaxID=208444 RepID=UPI0003A34AED|nr:DNA polymerase [Amycolatopsis vancoresmycina]